MDEVEWRSSKGRPVQVLSDSDLGTKDIVGDSDHTIVLGSPPSSNSCGWNLFRKIRVRGP